jgi:hypothetical protein
MKKINLFLITGLFLLNGIRVYSQIQEITAVPANDFLNSIGANTSINMRGEDIETTIQTSKYLGLRWLRNGPPYETNTIDCYKRLYNEANIRFSLALSNEGDAYETYPGGIPYIINGAKQLLSEVAPDAVIGFEGCNEPNNWGLFYGGEHGAGRYNGYGGSFPIGTTWIPVARYQRDLYVAVKADPIVKDVPVWTLSSTGAELDNVGLQYIHVPSDAEEVDSEFLGATFSDYATCHNYFVHTNWPPRMNNQTWYSSDPTSAGAGDCLYGNFGRTWAKGYTGYSDEELKTLPRVTTETGTTIDGYNVTEELQGLFYLSCYLAQFKQGWKYTAMYILRDRTDEGGNQSYGFYESHWEQRPNGNWFCPSNPRLSAHYLHNLTTILADNQSIGSPGTLAYSIDILPNSPNPRMETVHDLLLQKNDGAFMLVVWGERYQRGGKADEIKVQFDQSHSVKIYSPAQYDANDPEKGTRPVQSYQNTQWIPLTVLNRPYVLEIGAPSGNPDDPTSIIDVPATQTLEVYPNPVKDKLFIESDGTIQKVELVDLTGKNVFSRKINASETSINTAHLSKGYYILKVTNKNNLSETHKISKQ